LDNDIISKNSSNDYYFILGYMIFYSYIKKKFYNLNIGSYLYNMEMCYNKCYNKHYSYLDLMKIGISFLLLSINENRRIGIKFTDKLGEKDTYKKGFEFFKQIILDLNEESDLLFIYLQIYSGYGLDLINNKRCFKMSMIPIEDIKVKIIETIPKYFYTYFSEEDNYIAKDPITQVISFNQQKLFSYIIENNEYNKKSENNNIMNVTIGMLHESVQERLDGNTAIQEKDSPLFLNKNFEFVDQYYCDENQKVEPRNIIDYFLYNSSNNMAYKGLFLLLDQMN